MSEENVKDLIVCMPVYSRYTQEKYSEPPPDQSPCVKMACSQCKSDMWASEKKREMLAVNLNKLDLICMDCMVDNVIASGDNVDEIIIYDLANTKGESCH